MRGDLDLEGLAVAVGYVNQNPDDGGASDWVWLRDTEDATEAGPGWDDILIAESLADLHADWYLSVPVAKVPAFAAWVGRIAAALVPGEDQPQPQRPTIVCLCGSTRFWREFQRASLAETLAGRIVLSIGAASGTDDEHFGDLPPDEYQRIKAELDQLHLRKVELADEVLILNCGGYVGESTARELAHAYALGKRIRFLEPEMEKVVAALKRAAAVEIAATSAEPHLQGVGDGT